MSFKLKYYTNRNTIANKVAKFPNNRVPELVLFPLPLALPNLLIVPNV